MQPSKSKDKLIALLPMKGHSERVPGKNVRIFGGRPLFHHVADILQQSDYVETIVIDTDSEIIANDARRHFSKVRIVDRPLEIRGDFVSMNEIIAYDLSIIEGEHFLQTHSTNPLLVLKTLNRAIEAYFSMPADYDSLFSVNKLQTRLYWESGEPVNHNPAELLRTQDLPPLYEENSNFYIFSRTSFIDAGNRRIGNDPKMFVMDSLEAIDIDTEAHFVLAEAVFEQRRL